MEVRFMTAFKTLPVRSTEGGEHRATVQDTQEPPLSIIIAVSASTGKKM